MAADIWPVVHAERRALADDLAGITGSAWSTPSLCDGWTVHQVLGHLTAQARLTPVGFVTGLASAGFSFGRFTDRAVTSATGDGPQATLQAYRGAATATSSPPGPRVTWLGETLVHAEDIRRPLGIAHAYPLDAVTTAAAFYAGSNALIGGKRRVSGLTLRATDTDWSHGEGPEVTGPAMSLLLATTGRTAAYDDLDGPGLATLRGR